MEKKSNYTKYANSEFHLPEASKMKWPTCLQVQEKKIITFTYFVKSWLSKV